MAGPHRRPGGGGRPGLLLRSLGKSYLRQRRVSRWLRRRFTPLGLILLGAVPLTLGISNPEETMGMAVAFVLTAMLALAAVLPLGFRGRFAIERRPPPLATAGEPFPVRVRIENRGTTVERGLEYREDLRDPPLTPSDVARRLRQGFAGGIAHSLRSAQVQPVSIPPLAPGASVEIQLEITPWRRGSLVLAGGLISRADPLGLIRALIRVPAAETVLVMPRRFPLPPLALPGLTKHQQGGVALAAGIGESEDFVALREYRRGDPLKRVHWRSSARTGRLVVKEFQDEWFVRHALVLDTACAEGRDHLFEDAVAVATSFACTIPDQESLLDLLLVAGAPVAGGPVAGGPVAGGTEAGETASAKGLCITTGRGVGHPRQMLEVLASVQPLRTQTADTLEALVLQHAPQMSDCLLVLLAWDQPRRDLIRRLKGMGLPTLVLLVVDQGQAKTVDLGEPADRPDRLLVLESGKIGEGLRQLEDRV